MTLYIVHDIVQEAVVKTIPEGKKNAKRQMVVWGGLTNSWEKKKDKGKREK